MVRPFSIALSTLQKQPETILLQAQWEADPGAWLRGEVDHRGLARRIWPADNRVFFSLPPVLEGKVALLAQSPYLRLALSPEIMRGQWAARVLDPAKLAAEIAANHDADVLCIESNYLQSGDARKLLWRYLHQWPRRVLARQPLTPTIKGYLRELGLRRGRNRRARQSQPRTVPVRLLQSSDLSSRSSRPITAT